MIGLANIDIPRGRQARQAWRQLDRGTRREVIQRARRGLGHPDLRVAAIAVGRAQATLTMPLWRWLAAGLVMAAAGFVVAWLLDRWLLRTRGPGLWYWIAFPIIFSPLQAMVGRTQARWVEQANLRMVGGASMR